MSKSHAHITSLVLSLAFLAVRATASTYVVDSSGGGQFTDIPAAIAAAQAGDVLLVMPGVYGGFTLDKGLTIVGYGTVTIAGDASVVGVPATDTAALVALAPEHLAVSSCAGHVIALDFAAVQHIGVQGSTDVRIRHVDTAIADGPPATGADLSGSRVELVRCSIQASNAPECASLVDGGTGLALGGSSRVQLALSNAYGGGGAYCFNQPYPQFQGGNGGPAIIVAANDTLYLTGGGQSQVFGGGGGLNFFYDHCLYDGAPSVGIGVSANGTLIHSGATIVGPSWQYGIHCIDFPGIPISSSGLVIQAMPPDPTLDVGGSFTAGGNAIYTLRAPAGSTATLYFGRHAVVIPDPNTAIEQLAQKSRIVHLGIIPPNGQASFTWPIAVGLPPGMLLVAQAEVQVSAGDVRHTNSIPVVLH